jgi:aminoglycoside phosphotransferase (APT) family kinase protein
MDSDTGNDTDNETGIDRGRLAAWIAGVVDRAVTDVVVTRLDGGHSSGAWRVDTVDTENDGGEAHRMVLKAPSLPSVVFRRDACAEARIVDALARAGAPVPAVLAVDDSGTVLGRPCFLLDFVEGRAVADSLPGYHGDGWFRDAPAAEQHAIWHAFHDALAAVHAVDAAAVPVAIRGSDAYLDYWRASLLDSIESSKVPRHLAMLDWLGANLPPDADDAPAVCMGDARIANCLVQGTAARALVDFEVAYVGNPAADVGYSLFFDALQRRHVEQPLDLPPAEVTWARWGAATGRSIERRDYWTAFGVAVLCVTATRAMLQWGVSGDGVEDDNFILPAWEATIDRAAP